MGSEMCIRDRSDTPVQNYEDIAFIEEEIIGQLLIAGGSNEIRRITEKFWASTRSLMSVIHENLALAMRSENDALSNLRRAAHGIKGSSANLGLLRLSRIAETLQNAPPDKIGSLVLGLTGTINPSAQLLEQRITGESNLINTDSAGVHFDDVNAQIKPTQSRPSQSKSPSPHKISTEEVLQRRAQVP